MALKLQVAISKLLKTFEGNDRLFFKKEHSWSSQVFWVDNLLFVIDDEIVDVLTLFWFVFGFALSVKRGGWMIQVVIEIMIMLIIKEIIRINMTNRPYPRYPRQYLFPPWQLVKFLIHKNIIKKCKKIFKILIRPFARFSRLQKLMGRCLNGKILAKLMRGMYVVRL